MKEKKSLNILLKVTAIFLWYFVVLFFFLAWDLSRANPFFEEGSFMGDMVVRQPYQWDFELFFAGLFLVWGVFLWQASKEPQKNSSFIRFTGWAFLVHAITMIIVGLIKSEDFIHLVSDSIYWFLFSSLLLYLQAPLTQQKKRPSTKQAFRGLF